MSSYKIETERADLFDVNMMIAMQFTVMGKATEEELTEAFLDTVSAFEILNCSIVISENGEAYYQDCEKQRNTITFRNFELETLIREQERVRFRLEEGEFLRCFVDFTDEDGMKVCLLMHHLGGDGKSLCYFIESFLRRLGGEALSYQKAVFLNGDSLPEKTKLPFPARLLVRSYNRAWKKERRVFGFEELDEAFTRFWKNHATEVRVEATESDALHGKLAECKASGAGFTAYTVAEMIRDTTRAQDVGLAVDGRLDGNRTMSNQATGISVNYRYDKRKTIGENAAAIDGLMRKKLKNDRLKYFILPFMAAFDPTLVDAVNLEFAGTFHSRTSAKLAKLLGYGENTKDLSVTNLTKADIPTTYGKFTLSDLIFVPPVISYGKNIVGMVTVGERLNTAFHHYTQGAE
jgi:Condensation domain.